MDDKKIVPESRRRAPVTPPVYLPSEEGEAAFERLSKVLDGVLEAGEAVMDKEARSARNQYERCLRIGMGLPVEVISRGRSGRGVVDHGLSAEDHFDVLDAYLGDLFERAQVVKGDRLDEAVLTYARATSAVLGLEDYSGG